MFTQGLFYKNLPSKLLARTKTSVISRRLQRNTFLNTIDHPFFIFTGTGSIDFNSFYRDPKILKKLSKKKVEFFLYEPVSYYFQGQKYNLGYYSEFHSDYDHRFDLLAAELDSINSLGKDIGKIAVNHCDYRLPQFLGYKYPFIKMQCRDIFIRDSTYNISCSKKAPPVLQKKFWCGNGRYTIHRHLVMCYLADKPGNYSWRFTKEKVHDLLGTWVENKLDWHYLKTGNDILNNSNFALDFETEIINVDNAIHYYMPGLPAKKTKFYNTYDPCFLCVINETRFAQPTGNFSEKVIDAIRNRKPFILVAPPKTLEYLKKFGFKTFDKYWPEDYDQIENHTDRMLEIFRIINFINSKTLAELNDMYLDMQDIIYHNLVICNSLAKNDDIIYDYR